MANLEVNLKGGFMICNEKDAPIVLQKSYLFQNFGSSELDVIANIAKCRAYEAGETIFHQGESADNFYIIGYGTVGLEVNDNEDYESYPVVLASGDTFAESHFHLREQHLATAIAKERSEIFSISYDALTEFLWNNPIAELKFTKSLAIHLGRYCHHLIEGMMGHKVRLFVNEGISSFV